MAKAAADLRSLARSHTSLAITTLAAIARGSDSHTARVMAANSLLDRGWGKAPQAITGENGEGRIEVVIRHIVEGGERREPVLIEQSSAHD